MLYKSFNNKQKVELDLMKTESFFTTKKANKKGRNGVQRIYSTKLQQKPQKVHETRAQKDGPRDTLYGQKVQFVL